MRIEDHINNWQRQIFQQITQYFEDQGQEAYLVGGSIRNLLWDRPDLDWDIATTGNAHDLARALANKLNGYYAYMNTKASRVTIKQDGNELQIDISPLQGHSIVEDLHRRDFTVNALALPLGSLARYLSEGTALTWIDPLYGRADIEARLLRVVDNDVFRHDPLRLLRAIRFTMLYDLCLDEQTAHLLTRDAGLLLQVAPERIHDELYAILEPDGATEQLRLLDKYGLFTTLLPEFIPTRGMQQPFLHHWDVFQHSLEAVAALERLAHELQQGPEQAQHSSLDVWHNGDVLQLRTLLYEAEQQEIFQFARLTTPALKLAALLHDVGKSVTYENDGNGTIRFYHHPQAGVPLAQQIMQRLCTSTQDRRIVQQVVANHMRPGQLSGDKVTPRAIRRYFTELGPAGIYVALISLSDHLAMRGPDPLTDHWARHLATVRLLCQSYIRERDHILPPRLVAGEELIRHLNLEPGPIVGQLLEQIAEAQAEGHIHSKAEALWFAEEVLTQQR
jgi:poly(A) polymerase